MTIEVRPRPRLRGDGALADERVEAEEVGLRGPRFPILERPGLRAIERMDDRAGALSVRWRRRTLR